MANQIPEELIEQVRTSNDIVDVIGEYVQLKKQGRNYFGLCPFHGEKTASFSVTQEKQIFHCFGCGKGGNVVTFLMEMENFSFFEAIKYLAERANIDLPVDATSRESPISSENQQILSAHEWLTKLFHHLIRFTKDGKAGYQYLQERGITDETIDTFQLGFAPNTKNFTATFLEKKGFHQQMLVKFGLLSRSSEDGSISDRFRGRVIFPIRNHLGKTIAFGARALQGGEPKYLNSPETELFQKGKILYNFDLAKKHIRKSNEVVLFEGYFDVISAYQSGVQNAVATMGTALTEIQAKLLKRYVDTVIICYDGDKAGIEATYRAAQLLEQVGCLVKIASIKDGLDPDSFIKEYGGDAFKREVLEASQTFMSFYMQYKKKDFNLSLEGDRIQYVTEILQELAKIESPVEREFYIKELSNEYNITVESLQHEINQYRQKTGIQKDKREKDRYTNNVQKSSKLLPAFHNAERKLLSYMLQNQSIAERVQEEIGASFNIDEHKIIATYLYAFYEEGNNEDVSIFIERLVDEKIRKLVIELALDDAQSDISDKAVSDYIRIIQNESSTGVNLKQLKAEQRLAEQQKDPIKAAQIALKIIELQRQVKHLN
ncbi:DNA primase [Ornithinibacillus bavariensis]|uniref:DNA primase n=1 Tax=Ornithinibacillus bavariensis TaxID=545502 RepID=A0A919XAM2_9BACI|nr:DNA primase [Ornithinibacillus bavariensis]GIO27570.1 DNA primase [Ornithinibacillus bavariensis]